MDIAFVWLNDLESDFANRATREHYVKFAGDISFYLQEGVAEDKIQLASKIIIGYYKQEIAESESLPELESIVEDATEYKDLFLLKSAYSLLKEKMD